MFVEMGPKPHDTSHHLSLEEHGDTLLHSQWTNSGVGHQQEDGDTGRTGPP